MLLGQALELCKKGTRITRQGWSNKDRFIIFDGQNLILFTSQNDESFWSPKQSDILAEDWDIYID